MIVFFFISKTVLTEKSDVNDYRKIGLKNETVVMMWWCFSEEACGCECLRVERECPVAFSAIELVDGCLN